jgi:hypothetical protein
VTGDLARIGRKYEAATLRERLLRPGPSLPSEGVSLPIGSSDVNPPPLAPLA